jgi:hypothetical protein
MIEGNQKIKKRLKGDEDAPDFTEPLFWNWVSLCENREMAPSSSLAGSSSSSERRTSEMRDFF